MGMYLGWDFGFWGPAGRKRCNDGGGLKRIKRVPGSVWASTLSAGVWVVGTHFVTRRDDVLEWPFVWARRRSLLERDMASRSRRLSPMKWKRAMAWKSKSLSKTRGGRWVRK